MTRPDSANEEVPFRVFHFFLHRCVVARSEAEARELAVAKWQAAGGDMFTITPLDRDGQMYVQAAPDEVIYSPEIAEHFHTLFEHGDFRDPGREAGLFSEIHKLNRTLSQIRAARSAPADVPIVFNLERSDTELWDFCATIAFGGEVDVDAKTYLLKRYPKLREVIIEMRMNDA